MLLRPRVLVVFLPSLLLAAVLVGCTDKDRRMGEFEALNYRRELVKQNYHQLSVKQRHDIMYHPARSQNELDAAVSDYRTQFREQQARDAAAALEARQRTAAQAERRERLTSAPDGNSGTGGSPEGGAGRANGGGSDGTGGGLPSAPPEGTLEESDRGDGSR